MNTKINKGFGISETLMGLAIMMVLGVLLFFSIFTWTTVEGNQVAVKETWTGGVDPNFYGPKTYFYNRWTTTFYKYETSGQVFAMNDADEPFAAGRRVDVLQVNSLDNQQVKFHVTITWRINPERVVALHKNYRNNIEERILRPEVVNEVGIRATLKNAIDLYSGPVLNDLRDVVTKELRDSNGKLAQGGIIVDRFVIEKPRLNPEYEKVIEQRQLAIATESQAKEQEKANLALAEAAKAAAQKSLNEQVVAADAAKQVAILQQEAIAQQSILQAKANATNTVVTQEAESQKVVIAAKAEAARNIAISEAQKQAEINRSIGILAVGKSEAEANKLKFSAYAVPGADDFVKIQVAQSLGVAFSNVKGYLPAGTTYNTIAKDFDTGVNILLNPTNNSLNNIPTITK